MPSSADSFLRQLSGKEAWKSSSRRWGGGSSKRFDGCGRSLKQVEGLNMYGSYIDGLSSEENGGGGLGMRKRVMVVVDNSSYSKHAMIWALTHVTNKADLLTLLHIIPPSHSHTASDRAASSSSNPADLASSLGSLCKACKPEVEVEALVIQGPKLATVMSQVKKLEVSVLVLGQRKPSSFLHCLCGSSGEEDFVEQCINGTANTECLAIGVRKQSRGVGGYLITTRCHKNFWLLA
ncbi:uncharacterized protein LOC131162516 isoform X1 [Malania oleifera]|uniref:uncharacterized protein LOC131162516 isoform X1 n=1 Tax=Malania oleifera TaxID=397392 RepID=UPI0025ADCE89|nr:uncharacterized protein LOC131162516 isoform X1 [Malania oleifera]